jgi:hypothetical protein
MTDVYKQSVSSRSIFIELVDSTTGLPKTGIVFGDVTGSYVRTRSARVAITMATLASASTAYSSGGFILIDDTNQPGVYRLDVPDAAILTGAEAVVVTVKATGCRTVSRLFDLVDVNNQVAYAPNVAAGGIGGLLTAPTIANTGLAVTTVTTLTGHTPQTGDSFARIGATGSGLTSLSTQTSVDSLGGAAAVTVERSISDTKSITFAWPVSGATITGTRSIDNASYGAVTGAIAFLRTETGTHYYTLAYNAADRPSVEGQVRYKFVDGAYTRYVVLRVETAVLDSAANAALVDLIWDEPLTKATHNVATSSGKRLRQTTAFQQIDSTVIDASATTTTFVTDLTSTVDDFYNDSMLVFTDGALVGQVRAILDYVGATKTIVLEEALTSAPVNGVAFAIVSLHIHPVSQIQSGLATAASIVTLRGADSDTLKTLSDQIDTVSTNVSSIASVSREAF